ncbi:MAG: glycine zipper domain-containing protein [Syntrophotaleaceae bacterium]
MKKGNRKGWMLIAAAVIGGLLCGPAIAPQAYGQEPFVYPAKGQSADQVGKDKFDCYQWARQQSGFDPMQQTTAQAPAAQRRGGGLRGAAGGALAGAAVGAIAGDAGTGAAIGAASGGIIGGARQYQGNVTQEQAAQQAQAGHEQQRALYNRAWGACMEGRGYTVN